VSVHKAFHSTGRCACWMKNHPFATNLMIVVGMALLVGVGSYLVGVLSIR
jgi:hypothetical protein